MNEVTLYIEKQASPQKEICFRLREIILDTFPSIKEEMKWGVPTFGDGLFYIVALKDHVNLGFSSDGLSVQELSLFEGSGKTMKHIKIKSPKDLDIGKITRLLELVGKK